MPPRQRRAQSQAVTAEREAERLQRMREVVAARLERRHRVLGTLDEFNANRDELAQEAMAAAAEQRVAKQDAFMRRRIARHF